MVDTDAIPEFIVTHSRLVIAVLLLSSVVLGAGATNVERSASLERFQKSTQAGAKADYVAANFSNERANTTQALIVVRGENVLSKQSLLAQLYGERALRNNRTVNESFAAGSPPVGIANVVATTAILQERGRKLQSHADRLNTTARWLADLLNRTRDIQHRYYALNQSHRSGKIDDQTYQNRSQKLQRQFDTVRQRAATNLTDDQLAKFTTLMLRARTLQQRADKLKESLRKNEINQSAYLNRAETLEKRGRAIYQDIPEVVLADEYSTLRQRQDALLSQRSRLEHPGGNDPFPPLAKQIAQVRSMNQSEIDVILRRVLGEENGSRQAFVFMPRGYEPGSTQATATMIVVTQYSDGQTLPGTASERIIREQSELQDAVERSFDTTNTFVFGNGLINEEVDRAIVDTMLVLAPLSLLFVILVLTFVYRDFFDIVLGTTGILVVLVWTLGTMGWLGFAFSPIFILVPVLLIGLSIDYSNHIFMRYREEREDDAVARPMTVALTAVGVALLWVTGSTAIGFLANVFSPAPPLREVGIITTVGITSALIVFGALVPALKVEVDEFFAGRDVDRYQQAFGTDGGVFGRILTLGADIADRAPWAVIGLALLLGLGGAYGAVNVDTSFQQEDFLAENPPAWMYELPEPFQPSRYETRDRLAYLEANFLYDQSKTNVLVRGAVANPATLDRLHQAEQRALASNVTGTFPSGEPAVVSLLTVMRDVAATNASFNRTLTTADTDGDGVPDRNVTGVYDHLFEVAPQQASTVLHRTDTGEYAAVRMGVYARGSVSNTRTTEEMQDIAAVITDEHVQVTLLGQPILFTQVQEQILDTVVRGLTFTLIVIVVFLAAVYARVHDSAGLGIVTLIPVLFSVAWIFGTMYLLDIPFNAITAMIGSITLGLGVDYTIHLSERYSDELGSHDSPAAAMRSSVRGTGGALFGSAMTTAGGFGVLTFSLLPPMQQFGLITAITIIYAFLASVFVLPSLLVVWTR